MEGIIKLADVESSVIDIQGTKVIPDFLVARLYGVETRDINKAVKNNPQKFPEGYILICPDNERKQLVEIFHQFNLKHSHADIKLFMEKGLYMLASSTSN